MPTKETIQRNLERVRARISAAAMRAGRHTQDITMVAVTKMVGADEARILHELGVADLGENRVQEAERKIFALQGIPVRWHMIGHLQSNKARKVAGRFELVHSVDSLHVAEALDKMAAQIGAAQRILLEVNISGEATKSGLRPEQVRAVLERMQALANLRVEGLMTMAPIVENPEETRPVFSALRQLMADCRRSGAAGESFRHLSMGMSQDFEIAVEEGATLVRIGTALFRED
jgi:PLP dependent protein